MRIERGNDFVSGAGMRVCRAVLLVLAATWAMSGCSERIDDFGESGKLQERSSQSIACNNAKDYVFAEYKDEFRDAESKLDRIWGETMERTLRDDPSLNYNRLQIRTERNVRERIYGQHRQHCTVTGLGENIFVGLRVRHPDDERIEPADLDNLAFQGTYNMWVRMTNPELGFPLRENDVHDFIRGARMCLFDPGAGQCVDFPNFTEPFEAYESP